MSDNNDYEKYLQQDEKSWGEFFSNMSKYWHGAMADVRKDISCATNDEEYNKLLANLESNPENAKYAEDLKKTRAIAKAVDKSMSAIGKCIDGASALFGKKE